MSSTPHLYAFTGNLLAERTLEFADWAPGRTQRARGESFQVGGKGINVSKMLTRLGAASTALCFTGGAPGAECVAWLQARGFLLQTFATDRPTRSGTVVRGGGNAETTFLGPDVPPSAAAARACADYLDAQPDGQVLALCGSFPGWAGNEFDPLRATLERWLARGILAADTYGPPLAWFAARPLHLVKINATELRTLGFAVTSVGETLASIDRRSPVQRWVVTDGPGAVWYRDTAGAPASLTPPPVHEVSATGSGDVLHASLLVSLFLENRPLEEAVARAIPLASANAAHAGIAEFPYVAGSENPRSPLG